MKLKTFELGDTFKTVFYKRTKISDNINHEEDVETAPDKGVTKTVPNKGVTKAVPNKGVTKTVPNKGVTKAVPNDFKFNSNVSRARTRVRELVLCNPWTYFFTITLDDEKHNRYDLDAFVKKFGQWVTSYNRKYNVKLSYLMIPETHKCGAWHMHGLMNNLSPESIDVNEYGCLYIPFYTKRFGYINLTSVKSLIAISKYITKNITKASKTDVRVKKHLFYSSNKLNGKVLLCEGESPFIPKGVWQNDYVGIKDFDDKVALMEFLEKLENDKKSYEKQLDDFIDKCREHCANEE